MALQTELAAQRAWRAAHFPPDIRQAMELSFASLKRAGWADNALRVGDPFPALELTDGSGARFSLTRILGRSPVIVSFFCGHWSPYCNLELRAYYLRRGYQPTGERQPYPLGAGVGQPLDGSLDLEILEKPLAD